jgi:hypothetical protein
MSTIGAIGAAARLVSLFFDRIQNSPVLQSQTYLSEHRMDFEARLRPGFVDAGRNAVIDNSGTVSNANREIITFVSPQDDAFLRLTIREFRRIDDPFNNRVARAAILADFVHDKMSRVPPSMTDEVIASLHGGRLAGQTVTLGELIDNGIGECRHRTLLMKVLADDVLLPMSMVRGRIDIDGSLQAHAWNEVLGKDGEVHIVDSSMGKVIPSRSLEAAVYNTLARQPAYDVEVPAFSREILSRLDIKVIEKGGRSGVEINVGHLPSRDRDALSRFLDGHGASGSLTVSSVQNGDPVLRFFDPASIDAVYDVIGHAHVPAAQPTTRRL